MAAFGAGHLVREQVEHDAETARSATARVIARSALRSERDRLRLARDPVAAVAEMRALARLSYPRAEVVLRGRDRRILAASARVAPAERIRVRQPVVGRRGERVGTLELSTPRAPVEAAVRHWMRRVYLMFAGAAVLLLAALAPSLRRAVASLRAAARAERARAAEVAELERALRGDELVLHYQPIADAITGRVSSVEALLRWEHPDRGLVGPDLCLALAEKTGRMWELTLKTVDLALAQCRRWADLGLDLGVAVNLAASTVLDRRLVSELDARLELYRVPAERLELEITESAVMDDPERAEEVLDALRAIGVTVVALDDFGTGYSSLGRLEALPLDTLKIDRSFVARFEATGDSTMVRSIVDLAHDFGLRVVAEGVEDDRTWRMLSVIGCDAIQGYGLARPMPSSAVLEWMRADPVRMTAGRGAPSPRCRRCGARRWEASERPVAGDCPRCGGPLVTAPDGRRDDGGARPHGRIELVCEAFSSFGREAASRRIMTRDAVLVPPPGLGVASARYTGRRAFDALRSDLLTVVPDARCEPDAAWDLGDAVLISARVSGRRLDGTEVSMPSCWLVRVECGRIQSARGFDSEAGALEALRSRAAAMA